MSTKSSVWISESMTAKQMISFASVVQPCNVSTFFVVSLAEGCADLVCSKIIQVQPENLILLSIHHMSFTLERMEKLFNDLESHIPSEEESAKREFAEFFASSE